MQGMPHYSLTCPVLKSVEKGVESRNKQAITVRWQVIGSRFGNRVLIQFGRIHRLSQALQIGACTTECAVHCAYF